MKSDQYNLENRVVAPPKAASIKLDSCSFIEHRNQTLLEEGHVHKIWPIVSSSITHKGHRALLNTFLYTRLKGRMDR